jgi:small subunit ribosomal protein S10e
MFVLVGGDRENRGPRGDRGDYRRKEGANGDFKPEFRGGLGKFIKDTFGKEKNSFVIRSW